MGGNFMDQFPSTSLPTDEDYRLFIGNNSEKYIPKFAQFSITPISFHASWHWPAFLCTFWWFLYRKMYLWALLSFVAMMIPYINFIAWIAIGISANDLYYKFTNNKINELKTYQKDEYKGHLPYIGGVNKWVPWVAVIVSLLPLIFILGILGSL
jgi:hypothetical protein